MPATIYLIRHGQSFHNSVGNAFSGVSNVDMNSVGYAQSNRLAEALSCLTFDSAYTSPLKRARETAKIVLPQLGERATVLDWLIEINYGDYEGRQPDDLLDDPVLHEWNARPSHVFFPGGDSVRAHADRSYQGLMEFASTALCQGRIACFTHRTTIRLLAAKMLGVPIDSFRGIPCSNCSITEVRISQDCLPRVHSLNVKPTTFTVQRGSD